MTGAPLLCCSIPYIGCASYYKLKYGRADSIPYITISSMALLTFGLHGWTDEEIQGVGALRDLDESSKGMQARFGLVIIRRGT